MKVAGIVATYGPLEWRDHGDAAAHLLEEHGFHELVRHHVGHEGATLAIARNDAAMRVTNADWLCFVDADDRLAPGYLDAMRYALDAQVFSLKDYSLALLVPAVQYVRAGQPVRPHADAEIPAWATSLIELNCAVIGTLVPADLFDEAGGFGEEPIYEDWALWLRCVKLGAVMVPVPAAVYVAESRLDGRNAGRQGLATYHEIRNRLEPGYPWSNVRKYKLGLPAMAES